MRIVYNKKENVKNETFSHNKIYVKNSKHNIACARICTESKINIPFFIYEEQIQRNNKLKFAAQIFTYFTTLLQI